MFRTPLPPSTSCPRSRGRSCAGLRFVLVCLLLMGLCWGGDAGRPTPTGRDPLAIIQPPVSKSTTDAREVLVRAFEEWVLATTGREFSEIAAKDMALSSELIRNTGWRVYGMHWPKNKFRELLLGVAEKFPWLRGSLSIGWRIMARWEMLEPSVPHTPLPEQVLHSLITIFGAWGWKTVMLCVWLAYYALLRPGELCTLIRSDLMLPSDYDGSCVLVCLRSPKQRGGPVRKQYARVDRCDIHPFFIQMLESWSPGERLWPASAATFGRRLQAGLAVLLRTPALFTLGSLRAGGATALFMRFREDLPRLMWRGRWREVRTLSHYVQELVAAKITTNMSAEERERAEGLAALAFWVLEDLQAAEVRRRGAREQRQRWDRRFGMEPGRR